MSEKNIFDVLNADMEDIDENTLLEDTGINYENVRNRVMKEIQSQQPKKKIKKKVIISLIAATLAITALSATAVATGSFSSTFGEIISGDCVDGFYSGGNISVTSSNQDYNMEVLGVAGDDYNAYIALKITKTDGTPFKASTDKETYVVFDTFDCDVSKPLLDEWFNKNGGGAYGHIGYVQDDGSILCYIVVNRDSVIVKGQRLTAHMENIQIVDYEYMDKFLKTGNIENYEEDFKNAIDAAFDVAFDVSLDLNYRSTTRNFKAEESTFAGEIKYVTVSNFNLTINCSDLKLSENDLSAFLNRDDYGIITMNNGDTFYAILTSTSTSDSSDENNTSLTFVYSESSECKKQIAIDPSEVAKITINNCTFIPA
ncbi:MAG: hypothetical protein ACI4M3_05225 [Acutalibacteraceae bacterium]